MLSGCPDGATEYALTARGFSMALIVDLVLGGLATTATTQVRVDARREITVTRVLITKEGQKAMGE